MSDAPGGPGWWMANDHKWYPPTDSDQHSEQDGSSVDRFAPPGTTDRFAPPQRTESAPAEASPAGTESNDARSTEGPSAPSVTTTSGRSRSVTLWAAGVVTVCAAAVGMYFVGSSTSDSPSPTTVDAQPSRESSEETTSTTVGSTASTTTVNPTAEADLRAAAVASGPVTTVAIIETPDGRVGVTLPSDANEIDQLPGAVQLWRLDGSAWVADTTFETPATVSSWTVVDVTDDGTNDLVLEGFYGNEVVGMVLAVRPGSARLIPFDDPDGSRSEMTSVLRFETGGLTSSATPCVPSCADGGVIDQTWNYDAATDRFTV